MKSFFNGRLAMGLAVLILLGCGCGTVQLGKQQPAGIYGSTEIDGVHGTFTHYDKNGILLDQTKYDPEAVIKIPQIVYGSVGNRLFEWCPLFGADVCDGEKSFFAGVRYFEIQRFGLHFGGDQTHFVPFGICYEKAGFIGGPQIEQAWEDILSGNLKSLELGFMISLKL